MEFWRNLQITWRSFQSIVSATVRQSLDEFRLRQFISVVQRWTVSFWAGIGMNGEKQMSYMLGVVCPLREGEFRLPTQKLRKHRLQVPNNPDQIGMKRSLDVEWRTVERRLRLRSANAHNDFPFSLVYNPCDIRHRSLDGPILVKCNFACTNPHSSVIVLFQWLYFVHRFRYSI